MSQSDSQQQSLLLLSSLSSNELLSIDENLKQSIISDEQLRLRFVFCNYNYLINDLNPMINSDDDHDPNESWSIIYLLNNCLIIKAIGLIRGRIDFVDSPLDTGHSDGHNNETSTIVTLKLNRRNQLQMNDYKSMIQSAKCFVVTMASNDDAEDDEAKGLNLLNATTKPEPPNSPRLISIKSVLNDRKCITLTESNTKLTIYTLESVALFENRGRKLFDLNLIETLVRIELITGHLALNISQGSSFEVRLKSKDYQVKIVDRLYRITLDSDPDDRKLKEIISIQTKSSNFNRHNLQNLRKIKDALMSSIKRSSLSNTKQVEIGDDHKLAVDTATSIEPDHTKESNSTHIDPNTPEVPKDPKVSKDSTEFQKDNTPDGAEHRPSKSSPDIVNDGENRIPLLTKTIPDDVNAAVIDDNKMLYVYKMKTDTLNRLTVAPPAPPPLEKLPQSSHPTDAMVASQPTVKLRSPVSSDRSIVATNDTHVVSSQAQSEKCSVASRPVTDGHKVDDDPGKTFETSDENTLDDNTQATTMNEDNTQHFSLQDMIIIHIYKCFDYIDSIERLVARKGNTFDRHSYSSSSYEDSKIRKKIDRYRRSLQRKLIQTIEHIDEYVEPLMQQYNDSRDRYNDYDYDSGLRLFKHYMSKLSKLTDELSTMNDYRTMEQHQEMDAIRRCLQKILKYFK